MPSIHKFNLACDVRGVFNLGSWQKNTSYKSKFILKMMDTHPTKNIVFVDADAVVHKDPELFVRIPEEYNIAAHILDRNAWYGKQGITEDVDFLSGTLFIRNNQRSKELVIKWVHECNLSTTWEQKLLEKVLKTNKETAYNLPIEYCYINSLPNGAPPLIKVEDPVIVHHQCSRKYKNLIK